MVSRKLRKSFKKKTFRKRLKPVKKKATRIKLHRRRLHKKSRKMGKDVQRNNNSPITSEMKTRSNQAAEAAEYRALLDSLAARDARDDSGKTALEHAVERGEQALARREVKTKERIARSRTLMNPNSAVDRTLGTNFLPSQLAETINNLNK